MYKSLKRIDVRMIDNGMLHTLVVDKLNNSFSFNGNSKILPSAVMDRWLNKFFRLIRLYIGNKNEVHNERDIATVEIIEFKKRYSVTVYGRGLDVLNRLIDDID